METWCLEGDALVLREGVAAVEVPASWAGEVSHQLTFAGPLGPILAIPGERTRWLFLATPDVAAVPAVLPPEVRCWQGPRRVPAPSTRWVVAPGPQHERAERGALPLVSAVRCAIRTVRRALV
jgi:hypothetical protein